MPSTIIANRMKTHTTGILSNDLCPVLSCGLTCSEGFAADSNGCLLCQCNSTSISLCATVRCSSGFECDEATGSCGECHCFLEFHDISHLCHRYIGIVDAKRSTFYSYYHTRYHVKLAMAMQIYRVHVTFANHQSISVAVPITCPGNQTHQDCCAPGGCQRRCSDITNPPDILCPAVCVQGCCCPSDRPFLDDNGMCVPGTECPTNPCAAISCLVGFVCDPVRGQCVPDRSRK